MVDGFTDVATVVVLEVAIILLVVKFVIVKVTGLFLIILTSSIPQLSWLPVVHWCWYHLNFVLVVWAANGIGNVVLFHL